MPATRTVPSPYPTGQGSASVPVLFSLPNVQPAIAAASTAGMRQDAPSRESAGVANEPPFEPTVSVSDRAESSLKKLTSQLTNITIVLLLVAVAGLAYRNQQPAGDRKSSPDTQAVAQANPVAPATISIPEEKPSVMPETKPVVADSLTPAADDASQVAVAEPPEKPLVLEREAAPLLLPPAPLESTRDSGGSTAGDRESPLASGPYGTSQTPFSLTSSKSPAASAGSPTGNPPGSADRGRRDTIDTETPSLNTRDIILLRNGQRRPEGGPSDSGMPKVESVSRSSGARSNAFQGSGTPIMTGQSYPPIAPQYEPISMPTVTSINSRITQPPADASQKPPQKQYVPLSPVLPNPNEANAFDNGNP